MFFLFYCFYSAHSTIESDFDLDHVPRQLNSMLITVGSSKDNVPSCLVRSGYDPSDICDWKGVGCDEGVVRIIAWREMGDFQVETLDWLPSTLCQMHFRLLSVCSMLCTRYLPRDLMYMYLCDCELLPARLDLQTLPPFLEELHMRACKVTGPILLASLPRHIRVIDLAFNDIEKIYVQNDTLPSSLEQVHFAKLDKKQKLECVDGKNADKRIKFKRSECRSKYRNECDRLMAEMRRERFHT